jgi:hypothetical protein
MRGRRSKYDQAYIVRVVALYGAKGAPAASEELGISPNSVHHCVVRARELGITVPRPPTCPVKLSVIERRERDWIGKRKRRDRPYEAEWTSSEDAILDAALARGDGNVIERVAAATGHTAGQVRSRIQTGRERRREAEADPRLNRLRCLAVRGNKIDTKGLAELLFGGTAA